MIEESSPLVSALNCLTLIPLLSGGQNNHLLLKKCFIASIIKFSKYKNKEREREHKMLPLTLIKQRGRNFSNDDCRKKNKGITNYGNFQACNQDGKLKS